MAVKWWKCFIVRRLDTMQNSSYNADATQCIKLVLVKNGILQYACNLVKGRQLTYSIVWHETSSMTCLPYLPVYVLKHRYLDKMIDNFQTTIWNSFAGMKMFESLIKSHCNLFLIDDKSALVHIILCPISESYLITSMMPYGVTGFQVRQISNIRSPNPKT